LSIADRRLFRTWSAAWSIAPDSIGKNKGLLSVILKISSNFLAGETCSCAGSPFRPMPKVGIVCPLPSFMRLRARHFLLPPSELHGKLSSGEPALKKFIFHALLELQTRHRVRTIPPASCRSRSSQNDFHKGLQFGRNAPQAKLQATQTSVLSSK